MTREIFMTGDGSTSIQIPAMDVTYHSRHGAIMESMHVFIGAGFLYWHSSQPVCRIFEMGFGTGLNALLTLIEAQRLQCKVVYTAVEQFPLEHKIFSQLNYCDQLSRPDLKNAFLSLHNCDWEKEIAINNFFSIQKLKTSLIDFSPAKSFDLIYYDAFAPSAQPELWTKEIFEKLYQMGGLLVTYCSKGEVQRAMRSAGFNIEKLSGARGKREMIRAGK